MLPWIFIILNLEGLWYGTTLNLPGRDMTGHPCSNAVIVTLFAALLLARLTAGGRVWWLRRRFLSSRG